MTATRPDDIASLGHILAARTIAAPFSRMPQNSTVGMLWNLAAEFDLVRFVFANASSEPSHISSVACAPTARVGDAIRAEDAAGDDVPWHLVTFNANGADVPPFAPLPGAVHGMVIPPAADPAVPRLALSDWIPVPALKRADGGPGALLLTRHFTVHDRPASCVVTKDDVLNECWEQDGSARDFSAWVAYGIDGTAPQADIPPPRLFGHVSPFGVHYASRVRGAAVLAIGDSITQGSGSPSGNYGWAERACHRLSTPALPVELCSQAVGGSRSETWHANAIATLAHLRPAIVLIPVWTPNDPPTADSAAQSWRIALDLIGRATAVGAVPILTTPIPVYWTDNETEAHRQSCAARARAAGWPLIDFDRVMSDNATPARIPPAYDCGDRIHPSPAGYEAMAKAAIPVLARVLGITANP